MLRRVRPRAPIGRRPLQPGEQLLIVLDTETTGLDSGRHEIIELGMLAVIHDADGVILGVAEEFTGLHEPATPLSAEITAITGITPEMLAGQTIDIAAVEAFIADADRVCCHNAGFDRGFAERFAGSFAHLPWACSLREIDWAAIGTIGTKLEHILGHFGLFHGAHRAAHDCHALLEILAQPHPAGGTILRHLIAASERATGVVFEVSAIAGGLNVLFQPCPDVCVCSPPVGSNLKHECGSVLAFGPEKLVRYVLGTGLCGHQPPHLPVELDPPPGNCARMAVSRDTFWAGGIGWKMNAKMAMISLRTLQSLPVYDGIGPPTVGYVHVVRQARVYISCYGNPSNQASSINKGSLAKT